MLCMNSYQLEYVKACKARLKKQVVAYEALTKTLKSRSALETFEPEFFNNLVLVLESYFMHRSRTIEGKDGNAANEVRILCTSMLENDGLYTIEKVYKFKPEATVLKLQPGDPIAIREKEFAALARAYFAEIERKFT